MALQASRLLMAQNWFELNSFFQSHQPDCAEEFCIRAILNLYSGRGSPDWASVIDDLRRACELNPGDPLLSCNLTQALLDTRQIDLAYQTAEKTSTAYPNSVPALEKYVLAAAATQRWPEAYRSLVHAKNLLGNTQPMSEWTANLLAELSPQWWVPLEAGGVVLRRPDASDAAFLKETFSDTAFMRRYHRFQMASDEAVESFISNARRSPRQAGRLDWVILDRNNAPVGLLAFVDIDWRNDRSEILIGLPGKKAPSIAPKASVAAIKFAFEKMGWQKIVGYVYADNSEAQAYALHFGFVQEGLLRSHINGASGRVGMFINGLTPSDFAANSSINALARRWMPQPSPDLDTPSFGESSNGGVADFGMGGNVSALVTFTPLNAGAYYVGVRNPSANA